MLSKKLLIALGSIVLIVGSAVGYRLVTGQCPLGALMHCGASQAAAPAQP